MQTSDDDGFNHALLRATKLHANRFSHARLRNYNLPVIINTNLEAVADAKIKWNQQVEQETKDLKKLNEAEEKQIAQVCICTVQLTPLHECKTFYFAPFFLSLLPPPFLSLI